MRAIIVAAFVDGDDASSFPFIESVVAMRTVVFVFSFAQPFVNLECALTDFTFQLSSFLPIVEIDIVVGRVTVRTRNPGWNL
jgi:hypothetical protein